MGTCGNLVMGSLLEPDSVHANLQRYSFSDPLTRISEIKFALAQGRCPISKVQCWAVKNDKNGNEKEKTQEI